MPWNLRTVGGYVEHHYDLKEFGFSHGQFGDQAAVKLSTVKQIISKIGPYLDWLYQHGHRDLHEAGRMWLSRQLRRSSTFAQRMGMISKFTVGLDPEQVIPALTFARRHGKPIRTANPRNLMFLLWTAVAYDRICQHSDPKGKRFQHSWPPVQPN